MNFITEESFTPSFEVQFGLIHEVFIRLMTWFLIQRLETGHRKGGHELRQCDRRGKADVGKTRALGRVQQRGSLDLGSVSYAPPWVWGPPCPPVGFLSHPLLSLLQLIPHQPRRPCCSLTSPNLFPPRSHPQHPKLIARPAPSLFQSLPRVSYSSRQSASHYPIFFSLSMIRTIWNYMIDIRCCSFLFCLLPFE